VWGLAHDDLVAERQLEMIFEFEPTVEAASYYSCATEVGRQTLKPKGILVSFALVNELEHPAL
jgi:hypothetical protein